MTNEANDMPSPVEPSTPEASEAAATPDAAPAVSIPSIPSEPAIPATATATATKPATAGGWFWGTGRRKASVARVRVRPGDGAFVVNNKPMDKFFTEERDHKDLMHVLESTRTTGQIEIQVNVRGGGYTGQAGAILMGLGRALLNYDNSLEPILRDNGFLTRDPRRVERKKPGQPGARKRFQFSKR